MRFKDFLPETPAVFDDYDSDKMDPRHAGKMDDRWRHVSTTDSGHKVHRLDSPHRNGRPHENYTSVVFKAHAPDGQVDLHVSGKVFPSKPDEFHVGNLAAYSGNTLKAHDLYHHIVQNHFTMVSDGAQSEGGRKTWERLAQKPGVAMYARPPALIPGAGGAKTYSLDAQTGDRPIHPSAMKDYYVKASALDSPSGRDVSDAVAMKKFTRFVARKAEPMKMHEAFKIEPYRPDSDHLYVAHGNVRGHRVRVDFAHEFDGEYSAMFRVHSKAGIPSSSRGQVVDNATSVHIGHAVAGTVKDFVAKYKPKAIHLNPTDEDPEVKQQKHAKYAQLARHLAKHFGGVHSLEGDEYSSSHKVTFAESLAFQLVETITDWKEKGDGMMVGHTMVGPHKVGMEFVPSHLGHYSASFSVNHSTSRKNFTGPDPVHAMAIAHTVASSMDHFVTHMKPASINMLAWDNDPDVQMKKVSKYGKLANYLADKHRGVVSVEHNRIFNIPMHTVHFPEHE